MHYKHLSVHREQTLKNLVASKKLFLSFMVMISSLDLGSGFQNTQAIRVEALNQLVLRD